MRVVEAVGYAHREILFGDGEFRVAAVDMQPGKLRALTKIFAAGPTETAFAAGGVQPWDADSLPIRDANNLMTGNDRQLTGNFAFHGVQVGVTDAAGAHT